MKWLAALVLVVASSARADAPGALGYQGRLIDGNGAPVTGMVTLAFSVWDAPTGGNRLWTEAQTLALTEGFYATLLGAATPLPDAVFDGTARYLELDVGGSGALSPRQEMASVPYAISARNATNLAGGSVDATSVSVGGQLVLDGGGHLAGPAAYTAGAGLTLASGAFSVGAGAITNAMIGNAELTVTTPAGSALSGGGAVALGGTLALSLGTIPIAGGGTGITLAPHANQFLRDDGNGAWRPGGITLADLPAAAGDVSGPLGATSVTKLLGRALAATAPTENQVLKFHAATGWTPDVTSTGTVTGVTASAPLTVATGSTTPALSLGTVPIANGGTGLTTAPTSHQFLRDDGAGHWTTGPIAVGDLPGGFSGALDGDVTGAYGATTLAAIGGAPLSLGGLVAGDVLRFTAAGGWAPDTDVTRVVAGGGIGVSASSGAVTVTNHGVLTVAASGVLTSSGGANPSLSLSGVVPVVNGGTGASSLPANAVLLGGASAIGAVSGAGTSGAVLTSNGAGAAPSWQPVASVDLSNYLTLSGNQTVSGAKTFSTPIVGSVTGSAAGFTGTLAGDVTGAQGATSVAAVGSVSAANVASGASAANAATSAASAGALVRRDSSGNFAAGTITASGFSGSGANLTGLTVSQLSGILGVGSGGTGLGSSGAAGNVLVSSGAAWQSAAVGGDAALSATGALTLAASGVTAGIYGSATQVPILAVDAKGRITGASTQAIAAGVTSFNGATGAVTGVAGLTAGTGISLSGTSTSPVVSDALATASQSANTVFAAPSGASGAPAFRLLAAADIPALDTSKLATGTLGVGNGGTGTASYAVGDLLVASGSAALSRLADATLGNVLLSGGVGAAPAWGKVTTAALSASGTPSSATFLRGDGAWGAEADPRVGAVTSGQWCTGTGSQVSCATGAPVTSVGLSLPSGLFAASGSPVTTTGTLSATLASQPANTVLASPNGSAGAPVFRSLALADLPAGATTPWTSVTGGISYSGGNVGIGLASRGGALDVDGVLTFGTGATGPAQLFSTAGDNFSLLTWTNAPNTNWTIGTGNGTATTLDSTKPYVFSNNSFIALMSANVGVKTSNPQYSLDVAGAVRSSSGGFVFPDGTLQTTAGNFIGQRQISVDAANVNSPGNPMFTKFMAMSSFTANRMSLLVYNWASGARGKMAVYASHPGNDRPDGSPLAQTAEFISNGAQDTAYVVPLTSPCTLTAGNFYWLADISDTNLLAMQEFSSARTTIAQWYTQAYASGLPTISAAGSGWYGHAIAAFP